MKKFKEIFLSNILIIGICSLAMELVIMLIGAIFWKQGFIGIDGISIIFGISMIAPAVTMVTTYTLLGIEIYQQYMEQKKEEE